MQDDFGIEYWKNQSEILIAQVDFLKAQLAALQTKHCSMDISHIKDDNKKVIYCHCQQREYQSN
jgi:hypothetical protein